MAENPNPSTGKAKAPAPIVVQLVAEFPPGQPTYSLSEPSTNQRFVPGVRTELLNGDVTLWIQMQIDAGLMIVVD